MNQAASKKRPFRKRLLPALLRRTKWIGIRIDLFITVREGETPVEIAQPPRAYNFGFLTEKNIEDLKGLQPRTDPEKLHTRFREGKLCFGVRDNSRLIAKMWCDLNEFNYPANYRKLAADEVYLYSAFVDPEYRGHGLAPLKCDPAWHRLPAHARSFTASLLAPLPYRVCPKRCRPI